jgi:hypothetical protein
LLASRKDVRKLEDMLSLIANVGFPIAVAVYLLIRIENKLGGLTQAIADLRECIIALRQGIRRDKE